MDSFIQVNKNEWEAFLEDLSEFEKKYQHLLTMLDMAESRRQALAAPKKQEDPSNQPSQHLFTKSPEKATTEVKDGFRHRLKTKLEPSSSSSTRTSRASIPSKPQAYASCSRCGFAIVRTTRFCQRCGADFGRLVCSCGGELGVGDRFCDRCGRQV